MGTTNLASQNTALAVACVLKGSTSAIGQITLLQKGSTLSLSLLTCWTPSGGGRANPAASCDTLKVDEKLVKSVDWDFSLFLEITPEEMFSSPGTIQSLPKEKRSSFSLLVKDVVQLALSRKPGALEVALLLLLRLVAPSNLQNPGVHDPVQIRAVQGLVDKPQHHPQVQVLQPCQESNGSH